METAALLKTAFIPVAAYLLGSIPFGVIFTQWSGAVDIRSAGSGNIGATNVLRISGKLPAAATLTADILKGAIPVWYALSIPGSSPMRQTLLVSIVALAAFFGHLFPLYAKFKHGGKGVATALGCFIALSPKAALVALVVFILVVSITRRVSAGSLAAAAIIPPAIWMLTGSPVLTLCAVVVMCGIWIRHKENIRRLLRGEEPPIGKKHDNRPT